MKTLDKNQMLYALDCVFNPSGKGLTANEIDRKLIEFCRNCPNPLFAMDYVLGTNDDISNEQMLEKILSMPARAVDTWTEAELSMDHPLRKWKLET